MSQPTQEDLAKLGASFYALGAMPEYSPEDLVKWMDNQADRKPDVPKVQVPVQTYVHNSPRISNFSGDDCKGEASYSHWKYDVNCLLKDHSESTIMSAVRRSLKGTASEVLLHLGEDIKVKGLLEKFDIVFGNVFAVEQLLEQFYSASQNINESVALWGCRLEEIVDKAKQRKAIGSDSVSSMLRSKFWSGIINSPVKEALRSSYNSGAEYVELLREARVVEMEFKSKSQATKTCQQFSSNANPSSIDSKLDSLLSKIDSFDSRLSKIESQVRPKYERRCFKCQDVGHLRNRCPLNNYPGSNSGNDKTPVPRGGD